MLKKYINKYESIECSNMSVGEFKKILAASNIPDSAIIDEDSDSRCFYFSVHWDVLETDEEYKERIRVEKNKKSIEEARERRLLKELKAKYENNI